MKIILKICQRGFSLAEVLVILLVLGVAIAATTPLLTKKNAPGVSGNAIDCIHNNASGINFDNATGNINSYPGNGTCYAAYYGCKAGNSEICSTLFYYADGHGTSNQTLSALKILRASCDSGGVDACNYFILRCIANSTNCTSPDSKYTLRYYTNLAVSESNAGKSLIQAKGDDYYNWNITVFVNEINDTCCNTEVNTACSIKNITNCPCIGTEVGGLCVASSDESSGNWANAITSCTSKAGGWRLPTKDELNILYVNKATIGGFGAGYYWSATEDGSNAWTQNFGSGSQTSRAKNGNYSFRCVR